MKKKKITDKPEACITCEHCIYIGEGDYICDVDEPVLVMEEHLPSDDYYYCGGADYESEEDYD